MPVTAVRGGIHRCIPRSLPQPRLRLDTASAHRDEMLTATFYCRGADARGQLEARAAQSELRKASDSLRRLLAHEGQDSKETVALIDDATKRLQHLRSRVGKHAELVNKAKEGEEKMAVERERAKTRLDAVEKNIVSCNLERVSILSERDEIRRDILRAKRTLEVGTLHSTNQGFAAGFRC